MLKVVVLKIRKREERMLSSFWRVREGFSVRYHGLQQRSACSRRFAHSPVAVKTCPRHIFPRPSNPFITKQKTIRLDGFCFGAEGGIRTLVWFPTN